MSPSRRGPGCGGPSHGTRATRCWQGSVWNWDWEKAPIPLLPHGSHTPAQQGSSWAYLFRSVHAVPGFVFQEILFSKVTFATLGTLKWLLSSVFPWGMQTQNPITACQQHLHKQAREVTGKGEVGTSPHPSSATIHSCPKAAFMTLFCPFNSTAVSAHCTARNTISAGPRFPPNTSKAKLELSLQGYALHSVIHPGAPHRAQPCVSSTPPQPRALSEPRRICHCPPAASAAPKEPLTWPS